jgi:TPR repeat protein
MSKKSDSKYDRALRLAQASSKPPKKVYDLLVAADADGDARATYALATWYLNGSPFTPVNWRRGVQMLKKAVKLGVAGAAFDLAIAYEKGAGTKKNTKLAFETYVLAALLGNAQSFFEVGRMYHWGIGVPKNFRLAKIWYEKAEALGIRD